MAITRRGTAEWFAGCRAESKARGPTQTCHHLAAVGRMMRDAGGGEGGGMHSLATHGHPANQSLRKMKISDTVMPPVPLKSAGQALQVAGEQDAPAPSKRRPCAVQVA